ncbi:unnamed protein product [Closterium sp. NIES-64]|nr:unnamed protein product [Closterium sp. NIES-64]
MKQQNRRSTVPTAQPPLTNWLHVRFGAIMGLQSARVALLCAVVVVVSLGGLGGGKLGAEAIASRDLTKPFQCDKNSNYGLWYTYACVCLGMSDLESGYYWSAATDMALGMTCPGPNEAALGRMAFGNKWLESVGYNHWIDELMRCARQPWRPDAMLRRCAIPNIISRSKELFVGNGYLPPDGKVNGRPWNWNPEPPYHGDNWRSWAFEKQKPVY